jgi:hypothetical protein
MPFSLKHAFQSLKADGSDNSLIQPSDWNAEHILTATDGKLLGTSGTTTVGEITVGAGLSLTAGTLAATGGAGTAAEDVTFDPAGGIAATDVQAAIEELVTDVAATYAPLASPALTGNPTAPTQTAGNNTTRIATTAFVTAAVAAGGGGGGSVNKGLVLALALGTALR